MQTIVQEINSLDSKKVTGPDGIPSKVIKTSVEELSEALQILFNHSVKTSEFIGTRVFVERRYLS